MNRHQLVWNIFQFCWHFSCTSRQCWSFRKYCHKLKIKVLIYDWIHLLKCHYLFISPHIKLPSAPDGSKTNKKWHRKQKDCIIMWRHCLSCTPPPFLCLFICVEYVLNNSFSQHSKDVAKEFYVLNIIKRKGIRHKISKILFHKHTKKHNKNCEWKLSVFNYAVWICTQFKCN